jgi:hypothetical protein
MKDISETRLSRRGLLKKGCGLIAMTIAPTGLIVGANSAWAVDPAALKPETFATLVQACRDIYPHDTLADAFYAKVVQGYDDAAMGDEAAKSFMEDGASALNQAGQSAHGNTYAGIGWEIQRVDILRSMQGDAFFQKLRGDLVGGIYGNPDVWPLFGYEGESASKGGSINRGFDDIDWLDQV